MNKDSGKSNKKSSFSRFLTKKAIRDMTEERFYQRGIYYFVENRVTEIKEYKGQIVAKVQGTQKYTVKFSIVNNFFDYSCDCPVGVDGTFCKHCVAAGLELVANTGKKAKVSGQTKKQEVTMDDIEKYLHKLNKNALVEMLMEQALNDDRLSRILILKTSRQVSGDIDLYEYKRALENAIDIDDFVDYRSAFYYAERVNEIIDSIEDILDEGFAPAVIELTEFGIECLEENFGLVDDSDGGIYPLAKRFQELHLQACEIAKSDPVKLAQRLFNYEMNYEYDIFHGAAQTYDGILGKKGLSEFRRLAKNVWSQILAVKHGKTPSYDPTRLRISGIMETLARMDGNIEELVKIKSRDLSCAFNYLEIAEICKEARMFEKATEWAEKGIKAFPKNTDSRLRAFLAEEYHHLKKYGDEMKLIWTNFTDHPNLYTYEDLNVHADRLKKWDMWRKKAFSFIREKINREKNKYESSRELWIIKPDNSLMVEIFLWENDINTAWKEAQEGGCSNRLWLELADKRAKTHPEDTISVYQRHVEYTIDLKNKSAYAEAVEYIQRIHKLMGKSGKKQEFNNYLEQVRTVHKRKINLISLLDRYKWK